MRDERDRAARNEDDLFGEIESLEEKLAENLGLQEEQQAELLAFKEKIALLEKDQRREDKGRRKASALFQKRHGTLYKNILVSERAVDGFVDLNEEMRLKAEKIIHQLNANPDLVTIKRKVFGTKNRETVLEVVFAYNGRLYFRRDPDRRFRDPCHRHQKYPGKGIGVFGLAVMLISETIILQLQSKTAIIQGKMQQNGKA